MSQVEPPIFLLTSDKEPFAITLVDARYDRVCLLMAWYDWETAWLSTDATMETRAEFQRTEGCPVLMLNEDYLRHRSSFYGDPLQ